MPGALTRSLSSEERKKLIEIAFEGEFGLYAHGPPLARHPSVTGLNYAFWIFFSKERDI